MEYTYDDPVTAEEDMSRWQVPANGTYKVPSGKKTIKSAIITDLNFENTNDPA